MESKDDPGSVEVTISVEREKIDAAEPVTNMKLTRGTHFPRRRLSPSGSSRRKPEDRERVIVKAHRQGRLRHHVVCTLPDDLPITNRELFTMWTLFADGIAEILRGKQSE